MTSSLITGLGYVSLVSDESKYDTFVIENETPTIPILRSGPGFSFYLWIKSQIRPLTSVSSQISSSP